MTAFLSRLVERSLPGSGKTTPMPVVPPLFAAGAMVEQPLAPVDDPSAATTERANGGLDVGRGARPVRDDTVSLPAVDTLRPVRQDRVSALDRPRASDALAHQQAQMSTASDAPSDSALPTDVRLRADHRLTAVPPTPSGQGQRRHPDSGGIAHESREIAHAAPALPVPLPEFPVHQATPAAPIVRVSIGRIEVRAVSAPPSAPVRPAVAAPTRVGLVLEDYLRAQGKPR